MRPAAPAASTSPGNGCLDVGLEDGHDPVDDRQHPCRSQTDQVRIGASPAGDVSDAADAGVKAEKACAERDRLRLNLHPPPVRRRRGEVLDVSEEDVRTLAQHRLRRVLRGQLSPEDHLTRPRITKPVPPTRERLMLDAPALPRQGRGDRVDDAVPVDPGERLRQGAVVARSVDEIGLSDVEHRQDGEPRDPSLYPLPVRIVAGDHRRAGADDPEGVLTLPHLASETLPRPEPGDPGRGGAPGKDQGDVLQAVGVERRGELQEPCPALRIAQLLDLPGDGFLQGRISSPGLLRRRGDASG